MAGLKPNDFHWIIEGKLAVSECIGGGGLTSRKIRREEEVQWLKSNGINSIFSLLETDFNLTNYQEVGFRTYHFPLGENPPVESITVIFEAIESNTPVIFTNLGGAFEILDNGKNGLTIDHLSLTNSCEIILNYIEDNLEQEKNIKNAKIFIQDNFKLSSFNNNLKTLISEIV